MNNRNGSDKQLRKSMRASRRNLSTRFRQYAAQSICDTLVTDPVFLRSHHIAFYIATDGELSPEKTSLMAESRGKHCFLPLMSDLIRPWESTRLLFQQYSPQTHDLRANRLGILEPAYNPEQTINLAMLDLVIVPLVAFDSQLNRLGMGKGYYDRSFGSSLRWRKPVLLGLAFTSQYVDQLEPTFFDVPIDGILTEQGITWGNQTPRDTTHS